MANSYSDEELIDLKNGGTQRKEDGDLINKDASKEPKILMTEEEPEDCEEHGGDIYSRSTPGPASPDSRQSALNMNINLQEGEGIEREQPIITAS